MRGIAAEYCRDIRARVRIDTHAGLYRMNFTEFEVTSSRYPSPECSRWNQGPTVIGTAGVVVLATL
ncbi:hypothetical protein AB0F85_23170 [Nocardia fluminea]|uniref:hypothetical protein n=1 Tax=Nocardia fluminea TaxID=134984 RepID=UPI0033DBB3B3